MEFKYIFFNSVDFLFAGLRILCVKMKTFLFEESALRHENKRNKLFPFLPGSLLKDV